ncbi:uncharacterized protein uimc1 [Symphorus nematophorus]
MALRKQVLKDASDIPSGSQQLDDDTQDVEALDDRDDSDELSSSLLPPVLTRGKRRRERENKSKEMTEEEMMDLALRLSEQEASITALRLQKEEEAMMKAIQESMVSQTQPCPPSQSQSLLADPEASLRTCSRRKLLYSNGKPDINQGGSEDGYTPETDLSTGTKRSGVENNNWNNKRKRKEGSPLLEMPDLSQTQKSDSQASSPCSTEILELPLDSPQSADSTQIDDCQLRKSPVFPLTGCRAEVQVPRLSQELLQTCRNSGFVLCSQDSRTSPENPSPAQPKSPTFPKSPKQSGNLAPTLPDSPVFSGTDQGDDQKAAKSPDCFKSPVFGRNTQHEKSPSACKPQASVCNSGFMFSSQDSLTSTVRSTSCRLKSPVFPSSPGPANSPPSPETSATCKSPVFSETEGRHTVQEVFSETDGGQTEQDEGRCTRPVFCGTQKTQKIHLSVQKQSASPSDAEHRGSGSEGNSAAARGPEDRSLRQDSETDRIRDIRLNESLKSDDTEEELKETSKERDSAEMELTSDMTLHWSDEDDDITPVGSPSPVFPEERPVHQADSQAASLNHKTAASPGSTVSNCRPSSSSASTSQQQPSTTEREQRPIDTQSATSCRASGPSGEPAAGSTVHYYWGVPFCPRGLDPDSYTKVILAQMEVYEKSLKQAQRCLLRKAEWGEGILPQPEKSPSPESLAESPQEQPFSLRRGRRPRGKKLSDADDTPLAEAEEEEENKGGEEEEEEKQNKEEEKQNEGEEDGQVDVDDCEVCPETQLSDIDDDRTQDLMMDTDAGAELRPKSPERPEVEMILQDDSPAGGEQQEEDMEVEVEVDGPADRKTKGNTAAGSSDDVRKEQEVEEEDRGDPDVEEIKHRVLQRSSSPELEPAVISESPETSVDCPICQGSFPVTEIEMHAAYCDGEVAVVAERRPKADVQVSLKPRRTRRRAEVTSEETNDASNTAKNQEKCYICQKNIPLRDYGRHTELCIQRQTSKTAAKGNLLSALEKTESRDSEAGPSGSKLQQGDVIDLRDDDDDDDEDEEEGGIPAFRISNSPIRSFTPISEATDCLIDFKKQRQPSKKVGRRRR